MVIKRHMVKLGDVCRVLSGTTPDTNNPIYWKGNLPWITPAEITEDSDIIFDTKRAISKEAVEKKGLPLLPKGTVLLSSRAPIGKVAIAGIDMYCNQGFKNLVCSDKIYNKYLYFFLKSNTKFLNSLGRGATFKEISKSIVENILIPCPNIQIQKQIAERLDKVQELIAKQKEQIAKLNLLIKSRFLDMFGDPISNSKKLKMVQLHTVADINPKQERRDVLSEVSFVPMEVVSEQGQLITSYIKTFAEVCKGFTPFREGDILLAKITPCMQNGKGCIAQNLKNGVGFGSTEFHVIRANLDLLNVQFLFFILHSTPFRQRAARFMTGSAGQKRLPASYLASWNVILPPLSLQTQFANFVKSVEQQKEVFSSRLSHLETLYKCLMQEYFG